MIEFEQPSQRSEAISADLRTLVIDPVAWEFRVDATRIEFIVQAELVSSNSNALQRVRLNFDVWFMDGTGDDGLSTIATFRWPSEVVFFTDSGVEVVQPITWAAESVIFAETSLKGAWAIQTQEFVTLADYAIDYAISKATTENITFHEVSTAWSAINQHEELEVTLVEGFTETGFMANKAPEVFLISESLVADDGTTLTFILGEAFFISETIDLLPAAPAMYEDIYLTDTVRWDEVGTTDARPGAFVPGAALLGSPK